MSFLFNELLYRPIFNALVLVYNHLSFSSWGLAVIIITIIIRIILFPFFHKASRNQAVMQKIQPQIKDITDRYKNNKEEQVKQIMALYKKHRVNPFSSFGLLFIQLPILIALYLVFLRGLTPENLSLLYSFVSPPSIVHFTFLGLINLKESSIIVVVVAAALQYLQAKLSLPLTTSGSSSAERLGRQMAFIGPVVAFLVLLNLPSVVGVYWITTSVFSIFQQLIINRSLKNFNPSEHEPDRNKNHQTNL